MWRKGQFEIDTDPARVDVDFVEAQLRKSYWASSRPRAIIEQSLANSVVYGVYTPTKQVGLARLVTDQATFAWVCDVVVDEGYRGSGIGKWLVETIVANTPVKRIILCSNNAQELYAKYGGFEKLPDPEVWMVKLN